ncbi:hypothetical protein [Burkholderia pseudomallei]|uniref:hypothetical protein n=1 Tax=Burkholderia pseudomallei TaxID=28450 RepID=UPI000A6B08C6|nr:hypothetical protein [Burkholderia pseudomallei]
MWQTRGAALLGRAVRCMRQKKSGTSPNAVVYPKETARIADAHVFGERARNLRTAHGERPMRAAFNGHPYCN